MPAAAEQPPAASVLQRMEDLYRDVGSHTDVGSVSRTLNELSQPDKVLQLLPPVSLPALPSLPQLLSVSVVPRVLPPLQPLLQLLSSSATPVVLSGRDGEVVRVGESGS